MNGSQLKKYYSEDLQTDGCSAREQKSYLVVQEEATTQGMQVVEKTQERQLEYELDGSQIEGPFRKNKRYQLSPRIFKPKRFV